jgi:hypothetical protein
VNRRTVIASVTAVALSAAATLSFLPLVATSPAQAADGTGSYVTWTVDGTRTAGSGEAAGTIFPKINLTTKDATMNVAKSATLTGTTPFGEYFGTSRGQTYLTSALASGKAQGDVTLTFAKPTIPLTWGFVIGDLDAEDVVLSATDADGNEVDVRSWKFTSFNYTATGTDTPTWDEEANAIVGNGVDTEGASVWVRPTDSISTLTITQIRRSGFPQYQLWVASDIITEEPPVTIEAVDDICTVTDTALVNGDFEFPVIPTKSFRQINDRDVPGWQTTASDRLIEIWSNDFNGVKAGKGNQFAELNATQPSELFQVVETAPGEVLTWSLLHRARGAGASGDTMSVNIGAEGANPNATYTFTDALPDGWVRHSGDYTVPAGQTRTRFGFESGPTASGNRSIGNFIDDIYFTTTECIPAEVNGGNVVEPEESPSPTPSASPSASPTESPSASPTDSPSESPSQSPTESPSASPDASPTASPAASPTASPSPVAEVVPNTPKVITAEDIPGASTDSTISSVEKPKNGTAVVEDGSIIYTPKPGFTGTETLNVTLIDRNGEAEQLAVTVQVGTPQVPVRALNLPANVGQGTTVLLKRPVLTNARQIAQATVECRPLLRTKVAGSLDDCRVQYSNGSVSVTVLTSAPIGVRLTLTAPAKGKYTAYNFEKFYRVR